MEYGKGAMAMSENESIIEKIIRERFPGKLFIPLTDACDVYGVKLGTTYNKISRGQDIPFDAKKMNGRWMVSVAELVKCAA